MPIPDSTPLHHLLVLSSHNSQQGKFQACFQPSLDHIETCLEKGCRSIELDICAGPNNEPLVRHGVKCGGLRLGPVLYTIYEKAFEKTDHPLFVFLDDKSKGNKRVLNKAAEMIAGVLFEYLYHSKTKGLADLVYGDVKGKIVLISFPLRTESRGWNALIMESPYSGRFLNVSDAKQSKLFGNDRLFTRVYPRNILWSRNFDPTYLLPVVNFVALNIARGGKHVEKALEFFDGTGGMRVKDDAL